MTVSVLALGIAVEVVGSFKDSDLGYAVGFAILSSSFAAIAAVALTGWRDLGARTTEPFPRVLAWTQLALSGVAALCFPLWIVLS